MNKLILLFLFFIGCNSVSSNKILQENEANLFDCVIPEEILNYVSHHLTEFEFIDLKEGLNPIQDDIQDCECPIMCFGDFNQNGKEDVAIILKYKKYKNIDFPNYTFPFLVVFNDYKEQVIPNIVYKTGDYKDEPIKTVIYDQFEGNLFSYIKQGKVWDKDVIDIIIPEKSSFFVYWNTQTSQYEYLNYLDDEVIQSPAPPHWFGHYTLSMDYGRLDEFSSIFISYDVVIGQDSCVFSGVGYQTYFSDLCSVEVDGDELRLIYLNSIEGEDFTNHSGMGNVATLVKDGQQYYIKSPVIADKDWEYNTKILLEKIKE